jgi:hypothetical protein
MKLKVGDKARLNILLEALLVFVFYHINLAAPNFAAGFDPGCDDESFPVQRS